MLGRQLRCLVGHAAAHLADDVGVGLNLNAVHAVDDDLQCRLRKVLEEQVVLYGVGCTARSKGQQGRRPVILQYGLNVCSTVFQRCL